MVFSSSIFLFVFFPVLFFIYFFAANRYRNMVLLTASIIFYAWGEPKNILLMFLSITVNYILGLLVAKSWKYKRIFFVIAVTYNLGMLFIFKYLNFAVNTINQIAGMEIQIEEIALPIGISFYTFQVMSYVIDVYCGRVKAQRNFVNLALYIALFPQLIAGPIVRYTDIEKQVIQRTTTWENARIGVVRFMTGFSKKVLIADQLSVLVDTCFAGNYPSIYTNWIGAVAYTLQIFFDFSGYSDMAIGLGKIFGFDFQENFNYPYIAQSIQEFWRRWHITLSSWFRDYVYIPLGGSRAGSVRTYVNYIIVFFMTGLWHGASFSFIVWGLFYVFFLIVERLGWNHILKRLPRILRHMYAIFIIIIGWVFFRADTLTSAVYYIMGMFCFHGKDAANFAYIMNRQIWFFMIAGILLSVPHPRIDKFFNRNMATEITREILIVAIFIVAICYMVGSGFSPFLYFRF